MLKLPEHLHRSVRVLSTGLINVYVIGTAHISKVSGSQTKELIEIVKPNVVFLELCDKRSSFLYNDGSKKSEDIPLSEKLKLVMKGDIDVFSLVHSELLSRYAKSAEVNVGEEFTQAMRSAMSIGASVVLGDRPVAITTSRLLGGTPTTLIENTPSQEDIPEFLKKFKDNFPWMIEALVNERDQYMVLILKQVIEELKVKSNNNKSEAEVAIVAVVGAAHLAGLEQLWKEPLSEAESAAVLDVITKTPGTDDGDFGRKQLREYISRRLKFLDHVKNVKDDHQMLCMSSRNVSFSIAAMLKADREKNSS